MNISYNTSNNQCYNDQNGSIDITNITLTPQESIQLIPYTIEWTGNISNAIISNNKRIITNLKNGTYNFRLININTGFSSDIYSVDIVSSDELVINQIYSSKYSCGSSGNIQLVISGGQPPYIYNVGGILKITTEQNVKFSELQPGIYSISVRDSNDCLVSPDDIELLDSSIDFVLDQAISPKKFNDYGGISFSITGNGPFELSFISKNNLSNIKNISMFDTNYIVNINNNIYNYVIEDLYPDTYDLIIKDSYGCSISVEVDIPNINPLLININISADTSENNFSINRALPIFDTLLIPYKMIIDNTIEWQYIKKYNIKNYLPISINGSIYKFLVTRTILNKYCLDNNKIEVLKLGNTEKDWFFYLQLAPSINLNTNPEFINAKVELYIDDKKIPITLGLDDRQQIDSKNISLIRGSFIVSGIVDSQFSNNRTCYISTTDQITDINQYSFVIKDINATVHRNLYSSGLVTSINFLDNFNKLIGVVGLNQNFCDLTIEEYQYLLNIKHLLININNFNYINDIYIYSVNNEGNGSISVGVNGQNEFYFLNETIINEFYINYYYFNNESKKVSNLLMNNILVKDIFALSAIKKGFYILRIKDNYSNTPIIITNNTNTINYEDHFSIAKQYIQNYNIDILPSFNYGDILVYIPRDNEDNILKTLDLKIPTIIKNLNTTSIGPQIFIPGSVQDIQTISQTNDKTNTSSLTIKISPNLTKCIIDGPNNYSLNIEQDTKLINMIPGVYIIKGNEQDLFVKNLYQNNIRILLDRNHEETINIKFDSYKDRVLIKE